MTESEELAHLRRLAGWVFYRSRAGLFSAKRSERDAALSDVNYWTEKYRDFWNGEPGPIQSGRIWCGERP